MVSAWRRLLRLGRPNVRVDVDDEIAFHLDMRERDLVAGGLSRTNARDEATRQFGDLRLVRDACITIDKRRQRRGEWTDMVSQLRQDLWFALRTLRRSPGFTATALVCLTLGIGITTTVFSAIDATMLRPLPYREADRLVMVYAKIVSQNARGINVSWADYVSWRDQNRSFSQLGIWTWTSHALSGQEGEAERVEGAALSPNTFTALGVQPLLGRTFADGEDLAGRDRVVVLGYDLWQRRYGGDRGLVGQTIRIDGALSTVIGIMPPKFAFPDGEQLWVPFVGFDEGHGNRGYGGTLGRLRPGITFQQAEADLALISKNLEREFPRDNRDWAADPILLRDDLVGDLRRPLLIFLGAVGFVLLIACANVANLMLVRGTGRERELAVRVAIGAGRGQLVRQMMAESVVLALAGGAIGAALSVVVVRLLRVTFTDQFPSFAAPTIDLGVLGFAVAVSAVAGLVFGMIPALRATAVDPTRSLRDGGRGSSGSLVRSRLRSGLVIGEIALSLMLLIGAALLVRSYRALSATEVGFDRRGVLSFRVSLPEPAYPTRESQRIFWERLFERLRALPGVERVGSASGIPFSGWNVQSDFAIEGRPAPRPGEAFISHYQRVSPEYLATIGVRLVRGRMLTPADRDSSAHLAVVTELFAQRAFPNGDPLGKRVKQGGFDSPDPWLTIVGVVGTFRHYRLPEPMGPALYMPLFENPVLTQTVVIRTSSPDPMALVPAVRRELAALDVNIPLYRIQSLEQAVDRSLWRQRFQGQVLGIFSALALVLAAVGIYGVIAYTVAQRTRELGVRLALGALPRDVVRLVLAHSATLTVAGTIIGLVGAFMLRRVVSSLLHGVSATDPATYIGVPLALGAVVALASWIPARRATRVDPVVVMRE
jgi:putative ABC transport system permease protein